MTLLSALGVLPTQTEAPAAKTEAGLESEGKTVIDVVAQVEVHQERAELAEAIEGLAEIEAEVLAAELAVAQLNTYQDRIESQIATLTAVGIDGLTKREATMANDAVAQLNSELPADLQMTFPATEDFGSTADAADTLGVGLENLTESAKKFWATLRAQLERLIEALTKWWNQFFGAAERLEKLADGVIAKAKDFKPADEAKKVKINVNLLSEGSKAATDSTIGGLYTEFSKTSTALTAEAGLTKARLEAAIELADKPAADIKGGMAADGSYGKADAAIGTTKSPVEKDSVIGGKYIMVDEAAKKRSVAKTDTKANKDAAEVTIMKATDAEAIAKEAKTLAQKIIELRGERKDTKAANDKIKGALDKLSKAQGEEANKEHVADIKALGRAIQTSASAANGGVPSSWASHMVAVSRAALDYAEKSLAA